MRIVADSSTLYSPAEGEKLGVTIIPASVIIKDESYKDFEDISSERFLDYIEAGNIATSSQPAIGDVLQVFEESDEEILFLSIGDGLSGTYQNAVGARNCVENHSHIHVVDTRTLAGPQRYLVNKAIRLREKGLNLEAIKKELSRCIDTSVSFVIPFDFEFLKRSGRLTPIAAKIGSLIRIVPVLTQTADKKRIEPFVIKRSRKRAVEAVIHHLKALGINRDFLISIAHGGAYEGAKAVFDQIKAEFSETEIEILQLSPSLITHGGPGCITIQTIRK